MPGTGTPAVAGFDVVEQPVQVSRRIGDLVTLEVAADDQVTVAAERLGSGTVWAVVLAALGAWWGTATFRKENA